MRITLTSVMLKSVALQKSSINSWQNVVRMQPEHGNLVGCWLSFFLLALFRCRLCSQSHSAPQLQVSLTTLGPICGTWCFAFIPLHHWGRLETREDSILQGIVSLGGFLPRAGEVLSFILVFWVCLFPFWIFFLQLKNAQEDWSNQGFVAGAALTVTQAWSSFEKFKTLNCKWDDKHMLIPHSVNYFNCY